MRRRLLILVAAVALVAIVAVGLAQSGGNGSKDEGFSMTLAEQQRALSGAPAPLAALHAQAGQLLDGSLRDRLKALRGHPVVVNKWASWCPPCRLETPIFAQVAVKYGRRIAFVGLDGNDPPAAAAAFLRSHPVSYPSYKDPAEKTARALKAGTYYPTTLFIDARGRTKLVHQGQFSDVAQLEQAIKDNLGV
jgi:thiol-disulfide isomerase/thioredoxin